MKSYIIRSKDRKRIDQYAERQTEIMQQTYINLILKLNAIVLHDLYGFGKDRFAKGFARSRNIWKKSGLNTALTA